MAGSKSIILHLDSMPQWDMLSDDQAGKLIKSLLTYAKTGEQPQSDDKLLLMAFSFFASQVERDGQKYAKKCETNKRIAEERESRKREERARTCTNVHQKKTLVLFRAVIIILIMIMIIILIMIVRVIIILMLAQLSRTSRDTRTHARR